jgi:hypothetical protein
MYVIPREGFKVPDPAQRGTPDYHLPAEGREVQPSDYWTRRLRDGDVSEAPSQLIDAPATGVVMTPVPPGTEVHGES